MNDFLDDLRKRPRRLRRTPSVRALVQECEVQVNDLIYPLFIKDGEGEREPIDSMPGQYRWPLHLLLVELEKIQRAGIRALALFPCIPHELKSATAEEALNEQTLVLRAVRAIRRSFPEFLLITDIALDPYTDHGHDGVLTPDGQAVDNDATVRILGQMALAHAAAGVDWVAPSDMMDGRVGYLRQCLDAHRYQETAILAYSAKFASAYYGPFREAVGSAQAAGTRSLDKRTYQLDPANRREALREIALDEAEGADCLMVKPAGPYLDVIRDVRERTHLPVCAYQVSGEYAQILAAAERGWLERKASRDESLLAIKRAGADLILTYFAYEYALEQREV